jgi:hypothetical protein
MTTRYAAMALNGLNDPSKILRRADECPPMWETFADAKAAVVVRAEMLREHLASSGCRYLMRSTSAARHFEVSIEYGPRSDRAQRPFKVAFRVCVFVDDQELLGDRGHWKSPEAETGLSS